MGWNGILVEQYQDFHSQARLNFPAHQIIGSPIYGTPAHLTQKGDDRWHESIIQHGTFCLFRLDNRVTDMAARGHLLCATHLIKPELIGQTAEASEIDTKRITLVNCFSRFIAHQVAMLLLAELQSNGIMGDCMSSP